MRSALRALLLGLLAYGPSFADTYRRAAMFVDKILKGANLAAARRLGSTLPPSVLERAEVLP